MHRVGRSSRQENNSQRPRLIDDSHVAKMMLACLSSPQCLAGQSECGERNGSAPQEGRNRFSNAKIPRPTDKNALLRPLSHRARHRRGDRCGDDATG
eukprot:COSAG01_NODE_232_length_21016_cov_51.558876_13_plen_97_part_00